MNRPYLVLVDGKLWDRKLTKIGAQKVVTFLREKGLAASLAYECISGPREIIQEGARGVQS